MFNDAVAVVVFYRVRSLYWYVLDMFTPHQQQTHNAHYQHHHTATSLRLTIELIVQIIIAPVHNSQLSPLDSANSQLSILNYQLSIINYQFPSNRPLGLPQAKKILY
jgi:hypothetical protein